MSKSNYTKLQLYQATIARKMPIHSKYIYLLILSVMFWGIYISCFDPKMDTNGDNAHYYMLSAAWAQGKGYVDAMKPEEPPFSYFPPGYPLLLAPFRLFTDSIVFLKILNGICLWVSLLLWWAILSRVASVHGRPNTMRALALVALLFVAFNPQLLRFSMIMMSEMPYLLLSTWCLWLLSTLKEKDLHSPWASPKGYLLLVLVILAFHVRTQGIILLAGLLAYALMGWRVRLAGFLVGGFVLGAIPWMLRNRAHGLSGSSYLNKMMAVNVWRPEEGTIGLWELLQRFFATQHMLLTKALPESVFAAVAVNYETPVSVWAYIGVGLLVAVMGYGLWHLLPAYRYFVIGYFLAMMGIIGLWSAPSGARYVTTLIPMLQIAWVYGLYLLGLRAAKRWHLPAPSPYVLLLLWLFFIAPAMAYRKQAKAAYPPTMHHYFLLADWVKEHLPRHTVVACRKPALFHARAHTYALRYIDTQQPAQLIAALLRQDVDYVVRDNLGYSSTYRYLDPALQAYPQLFEVVIRTPTPTHYLLRFDKEKAMALKLQE